MNSSVTVWALLCGLIIAVTGSTDDVNRTQVLESIENAPSNHLNSHQVFKPPVQSNRLGKHHDIFKGCGDEDGLQVLSQIPCSHRYPPKKSVQYFYQYPVYQYPVYKYPSYFPPPVYKPVVYKYPTLAPVKPLPLPTWAPLKTPTNVNYNTWNFSLKIPIYAPIKSISLPALKPMAIPSLAPYKPVTLPTYKPFVLPSLKPLATFAPLKSVPLPVYKPVKFQTLAPLKPLALPPYKPFGLPSLKPLPTFAPLKSLVFAPSKSSQAVLPTYNHKTHGTNYALVTPKKQQFLSLPPNAAFTQIHNVGNTHTTNNFTFIIIDNCRKTQTDVKCRLPVPNDGDKKNAPQPTIEIDFPEKEFDEVITLLLNQNIGTPSSGKVRPDEEKPVSSLNKHTQSNLPSIVKSVEPMLADDLKINSTKPVNESVSNEALNFDEWSLPDINLSKDSQFEALLNKAATHSRHVQMNKNHSSVFNVATPNHISLPGRDFNLIQAYLNK